MFRGHVIQIGQDNAGDCSIMSKNASGGPEMDLGCHGYDRACPMTTVCLATDLPMRLDNVTSWVDQQSWRIGCHW